MKNPFRKKMKMWKVIFYFKNGKSGFVTLHEADKHNLLQSLIAITLDGSWYMDFVDGHSKVYLAINGKELQAYRCIEVMVKV